MIDIETSFIAVVTIEVDLPKAFVFLESIHSISSLLNKSIPYTTGSWMIIIIQLYYQQGQLDLFMIV